MNLILFFSGRGLRRREGVEPGDGLSERRFLADAMLAIGVASELEELDSGVLAMELRTVSMSLHRCVKSINDSYMQFRWVAVTFDKSEFGSQPSFSLWNFIIFASAISLF